MISPHIILDNKGKDLKEKRVILKKQLKLFVIYENPNILIINTKIKNKYIAFLSFHRLRLMSHKVTTFK